MTEPPRQDNEPGNNYDGHRFFRGCITGTLVALPIWAVILWSVFHLTYPNK